MELLVSFCVTGSGDDAARWPFCGICSWPLNGKSLFRRSNPIQLGSVSSTFAQCVEQRSQQQYRTVRVSPCKHCTSSLSLCLSFLIAFASSTFPLCLSSCAARYTVATTLISWRCTHSPSGNSRLAKTGTRTYTDFLLSVSWLKLLPSTTRFISYDLYRKIFINFNPTRTT